MRCFLKKLQINFWKKELDLSLKIRDQAMRDIERAEKKVKHYEELAEQCGYFKIPEER